MTVDDIFTFYRVGSPRLSPDGRFVLYTASRADLELNRSVTHIWRAATGGSDQRQLTRGDESCIRPRWSPDGELIAFLTERSGDDQIWLMHANGGEAWQLSEHDPGVTAFEWAPSGTGILFLAPDPETEAEEAREEAENEVIIVDRELKNVHLWSLDIEIGEETRLTEGDFSIREFVLSPDASRIAFAAAPTPKVDDNLQIEVYLLPLADGSIRCLTDNAIQEGNLRWHPDGETLTFVSDSSENLETYYQRSIFLLRLDGSGPEDLLPGFEEEVYAHEWLETGDGGNLIGFSANTGVNVHFFTYDFDERRILSRNTSADGVRDSFHVVGNRIAFTFTDTTSPSDIWFHEGFEGEPSRITDMNPQVADFALAQYRTIHWTAPDGRLVEGLLILPPDYLEGQSYPMITQLHGGPESSYKNSFSTSWSTYPHVLAGRGYVLFQPNYRGSTGYGDDVMRAIIGRYFEDDIDDILSGIDYLVEAGIADPERLGVMGWSAGGHLTNWLVTHSNRFAAAASGAGMSNWYSFYAQTDMHYIREIWHTGTPYERAELFRAKSPINYVRDASTPTIIFCGANDRRVPAPQSWEMYIGLRRCGVTTEFRLYPGEPHGLRRIAHQRDKMEAELAWFDRYILGIEEAATEQEVQ